MAYYVLKEGYELCGWKGLPFGLRHPDQRHTDFFDRENYGVLLMLDGRHDIDEDVLTEKQKSLLDHLVNMKIALPSDGTQRLEPWQEYKSFPGMHKDHVQWSITGRCNYKCRHCFMSAPDYSGKDLTLEESDHILDELNACGIRIVSLTGGEPLVNPHFYQILDSIAERGMIVDTIYSNGALVDSFLLDELEKRGMHPAFQMSFDGVGWHDWLRGVEGAEETVIRKFRLLQERGYTAAAAMCLHKHNIGHLKESIDLMASLGVRHVKINVASPQGRWKDEREHFLTQDEANEAILSYIPQYVADGVPVSVQFCLFLEFDKANRRIWIPAAKFGGKPESAKEYACGVVKNDMYISPTGKVLPCMTLCGSAIDPMFDSVLEKPLQEILSDSCYRDLCLIKMEQCIEHNGKCRDCAYRLLCGAGCRAGACGGTGTDYMGIDEDPCQFFMNGWYEKAQAVIQQYKDSF